MKKRIPYFKRLTFLVFLFAGCNPTVNCNLEKLKQFDVVTADQLLLLNEYNKLLFSIPVDSVINYSNSHRVIEESVSDSARRSPEQFFNFSETKKMIELQKQFDSVHVSNTDRSRYGTHGIDYIQLRPIDSTVKFRIFTTVCKDSAVSHYLIYQRTPGRALNLGYGSVTKERDLRNGWRYVISTSEYRGM